LCGWLQPSSSFSGIISICLRTTMEDEQKTVQPIKEVIIDGLAVLKIVKHCNDSLPTMVAGSLLGLDVGGALEITYSYAFPGQKTESDAAEGVSDLDGAEYQMEMMKMLRDVHVDNNCVGWYQSMYMGTMCTNDVVNYQYSYQSSEELSDNSIVIMYDPIQSRKGTLVMKAFRLSEKFMELRRNKVNRYITPGDILEELPLKIKNIGYVSAFLRCLQDSHKNELDCEFEALSLAAGENTTEKHLELIGATVDELLTEQQEYQKYSGSSSKIRQEQIRWLNKRIQDNAEARENGLPEEPLNLKQSGLRPLPDAPARADHLLMLGQLDRYCGQVNDHVDNNVHRLLLTTQLNAAN
jgi:translation initiation factor 3 subunit H